MGIELPPGFRSLTDADAQREDQGDEDGPIPEGIFFAASPHAVELMTPADAMEYADFFESVIRASPHYPDPKERNAVFASHSAEKNAERIADKDWIHLRIRDETSGKMIGSLEAKLIADTQGDRLGNIKWTLAHPEHRREGIGTQLKLQLESLLKERGCTGIITGIKDDNVASIEMNLALGMVRDDSLPRASNGAAWYIKRFKSPEAGLEKPPVLYHASRAGDIEEFEPRAGSVRDRNEGPRVFGSPSRAMVSMFLVKCDDSWVNKGAFSGQPYMVISDEERFKSLDTGAYLYTLPNDTFENDPHKGLKELEWTSKTPVKPIGKEFIPSALQDMLKQGVKVYFVDTKTFDEIDTAEDHGWSILDSLTPVSA